MNVQHVTEPVQNQVQVQKHVQNVRDVVRSYLHSSPCSELFRMFSDDTEAGKFYVQYIARTVYLLERYLCAMLVGRGRPFGDMLDETSLKLPFQYLYFVIDVSRNISKGGSTLSTQQAAFRKEFSEENPQGAVT